MGGKGEAIDGAGMVARVATGAATVRLDVLFGLSTVFAFPSVEIRGLPGLRFNYGTQSGDQRSAGSAGDPE